MDDLQYLSRLKETQKQFLQENKKTQESRQKLLEDYKRLKDRLKTLPDTVSQPTMVPIGDVAFFPGTLIHTNEIMVLLGDNWFVERSAKQAAEIVERRIQMVDHQLEELKKEHKHIKSNLDYADHFEQIKESGEVKEIKEDVPDDFQETRGKKRVAHKPKHDKTPKNIRFKTNEELVEYIKDNLPADDSGQNTINHDELMHRLNELEREEQEAEERENQRILESIHDGSYDPNKCADMNGHDNPDANERSTTDLYGQSNSLRIKTNNNANSNQTEDASNQERHVKFKAVSNTTGADGNEQSEGDCISENNIHFLHTESNCLRERSVSDSDLRNHALFNSPSDIYDHFMTSKTDADDGGRPLKSILKKDSRSGSAENLKLKPILKTSPDHRPGTPEYTIDEPQSILKTPPDTQASDKRPGTPEHTLDIPKQSILKLSGEYREDVEIESDTVLVGGDDSDIRPILKSQENQPPSLNSLVTPLHEQFSVDDKRSILKNPETTSTVSFSDPEVIDTMDLEYPKSIFASTDVANTRQKQAQDNLHAEPKPILKNSQEVRKPPEVHRTSKAFSGVVVERTDTSSTINPKELTGKNTKKPMSKFKASRMKK